jgi:hypothetical protein
VILDIPRCDGVGKPPKKTHTWSSGTGVRTQDFPNIKCRARRLATVLVLFCGWNPWSYTFPVGRSRFLSAGTARSGGSLRGDDAWAGEDGATGALSGGRSRTYSSARVIHLIFRGIIRPKHSFSYRCFRNASRRHLTHCHVWFL